ncbi:Crp/Fnr family transcriptional regulator [Desulfothermus okinawensis JCM 13304]
MDPLELKKIPIFEKMSDELLIDMCSKMAMKLVKKDQVLFFKGDMGDALYIIKKGKIKISIPTEEGEELIISIFSDGDFFGELSLLDKSPRSADAIAITDTQLFVLHRDTFYSYLFKKTEALEAIMAALCERLRKTDDFLTDLCYTNFPKRLAKTLIDLSNRFGKKKGEKIILDLELTQRDLGAMLGVTRETVNRELMRLKVQGILTKDKKKIVINDLSRLLNLI